MGRATHGSARGWSNRDVQREIDRSRALWLWGVLLSVVIAAAPTAVHLHSKNLSMKLGYEINALERERVELFELKRRLADRRAALQSPASIESWGLNQRGLVRPEPEQVVVVRLAEPQRNDLLALGTRWLDE